MLPEGDAGVSGRKKDRLRDPLARSRSRSGLLLPTVGKVRVPAGSCVVPGRAFCRLVGRVRGNAQCLRRLIKRERQQGLDLRLFYWAVLEVLPDVLGGLEATGSRAAASSRLVISGPPSRPEIGFLCLSQAEVLVKKAGVFLHAQFIGRCFAPLRRPSRRKLLRRT